jgi:hypothetical protein
MLLLCCFSGLCALDPHTTAPSPLLAHRLACPSPRPTLTSRCWHAPPSSWHPAPRLHGAATYGSSIARQHRGLGQAHLLGDGGLGQAHLLEVWFRLRYGAWNRCLKSWSVAAVVAVGHRCSMIHTTRDGSDDMATSHLGSRQALSSLCNVDSGGGAR